MIKRSGLLLLTAILLLIGCTTTKQYSVDNNISYALNEQISLRVLDIKEIRQLAVGNGSFYPKRGYKFFQMLVEARNNSDKNALLKWNDIYVLDTTNKYKFAPEFVMANAAFNVGGRTNRPLKPHAVTSKRLIYSIPNTVKTEFFGINGRIEIIPHNLQK